MRALGVRRGSEQLKAANPSRDLTGRGWRRHNRYHLTAAVRKLGGDAMLAGSAAGAVVYAKMRGPGPKPSSPALLPRGEGSKEADAVC
jgi:hypothetical protein